MTPPHDRPGVSLVVLNWNGASLLRECLPSLIRAADRWSQATQLLVADNGSDDDSLEVLRTEFPSVDVVALGRNLGFPDGCNRGVAAARHEHVILLNNDVRVEPDFIAPLVAHLADPEVFCVTPRMMHWDGERVFCSAIAGELEAGQLIQRWHVDNGADLVKHMGPTLYASGAAMAFRASTFRQLGGFDELYAPFYWEDTDLGYRAWKRGLRCVYEPSSVVAHKVSASMGEARVPQHHLMRRNRHLFHWRHLTDPGLLRQHVMQLPAELRRGARERVSWHGISPGRAWLFELKALAAALVRAPQVQARRRADKPVLRQTDREVLRHSDVANQQPEAVSRSMRFR